MDHSKEQGLRVNFLSSLGGLVVLAGLENLAPDLLLGVFLDARYRLMRASSDVQVTQLRESGSALLKDRADEKKAWKSFKKAKDLRQVFFTKEELQILETILAGNTKEDAIEIIKKLQQARTRR